MMTFRWESKTRYYLTFIYQDLFGDWIVQRVWGGLFNRRGSFRSEVHQSEASAYDRINELKTQRRASKQQYELIINGVSDDGMARM